ncbi:MAG: hypoxanthine-guanine phosphoribosyltransferase [Halofilum sp. (in: g-proteobacteria)]|nr:hypoxanthine-guanine phosphoribosyltransferase [Halofilum sp. (in: g-proteobacteria)]
MIPPPSEVGERLFAPEDVAAALERMARSIDAHYAGADCLALCLLQGGIIPAGQLLPRLDTPVELDSVHVTRYRNTTRGGEIEWRMRPRTPVAGRRVLLVDDILDEGHSIAAVRGWCRTEGASEVRTAVIVDKRHARKHPEGIAEFVGLEVPDRYVFGYGMDYQGRYRNAPGIYAIHD